MTLVRLAYASEATFKAAPLEKGVEPHVAQILATSRRNNPRRGIVGGLYYEDSRFFQYLEGETQAVYELYDRIRRDDRHKNVKILFDESAEELSFNNWSMKHMLTTEDFVGFLQEHNLQEFDPHAFDRSTCESMIELIRGTRHVDRRDGQTGES